MIWYLVILAFFFFFSWMDWINPARILPAMDIKFIGLVCEIYPPPYFENQNSICLLPIFQHHSCLPEFLRLPATVPQSHLENLWYVREQSLGPCDLNTFRMDKGIVTHSSRILSFNYYFFHSAYHCVWVQTEAK